MAAPPPLPPPMWLILSGIGHVLGWRNRQGWHWTLCGTLTPNGRVTPYQPSRICDKCRAELASRQKPEPA